MGRHEQFYLGKIYKIRRGKEFSYLLDITVVVRVYSEGECGVKSHTHH
jgi:hypothetical protein